MAFTTAPVTIGTTATLIATIPQLPNPVPLTNTGDQELYIGGPTVTTSGATQGFRVGAGETVHIPASSTLDNQLYGIVANGSTTVSYLLPGSAQ